ncbi:MAG: HslU--HslV peptidase ATPase subunit [Thermotoga sp.]|nr:MAG: HslU--HslV peptidase ATPase subunit [Thermotoga sp.]
MSELVEAKSKAKKDFDTMTPREIVQQLDKYIIGQDDAKKAVAIAMRNRIRRQMLDENMKKEVAPRNILMIGPTGVGKTEIARRLAQLSGSPFVKVEATRFTEVGYVGKNVESMIRDLVSVAINMEKTKKMEEVRSKAEALVEEEIINAFLPRKKVTTQQDMLASFIRSMGGARQEEPAAPPHYEEHHVNVNREDVRKLLREGKLEDKEIEILIENSSVPKIGLFGPMGMDEIDFDLQNIFGGMFPKKKKKRRVKVREARNLLFPIEANKLIDEDKVQQEALKLAGQRGIIFLDEMDKIVGGSSKSGPDVSREGVQRDLLPVVEGTTIMTKYGSVKTDYILFVAAGAFQTSKPSDLIPELQGRFPIRVELRALTRDDFKRILTEPKNAITKQYKALLATEDVDLEFSPDGIEKIAEIATIANSKSENIGARRLYTVVERLLEDVLFDTSSLKGTTIVVNSNFVEEKLGDIIESEDLTSYIL